MFEASRCCAGRFAKGGRGSTVMNVEPDAGSSARAHVQGNGNNVIVLINRDTASVLFIPIAGDRRRPGISAWVLV